MTVPETTSAEGFERYVGGKVLFESHGESWRDIKAWIVALPPVGDSLPLPSVSEPFLAWTTSGDVDFQEREDKRPWITHRIRKGSFFLTSGGAPYDVRWKTVTSQPFEAMYVFVELPLLQRAFEEVFGGDAAHPQLRDVSAFTDVALDSLMERLRDELMLRLGAEGAEKALERADVRPMDFTGRPMTGMVYVAPEGVRGRALRTWVEKAAGFARTLPPKHPRATG